MLAWWPQSYPDIRSLRVSDCYVQNCLHPLGCLVEPWLFFVCRLPLALCISFLFLGVLRLGIAWSSVAVSLSVHTVINVSSAVFAALAWLPTCQCLFHISFTFKMLSIRLIFIRYTFVRLVPETVLVLLAPLCVCLCLVIIWLAFSCLFGVAVLQGWMLIHLSCLVFSCTVSSAWICMNSNWRSMSKSVCPAATLSATCLRQSSRDHFIDIDFPFQCMLGSVWLWLHSHLSSVVVEPWGRLSC